MGIKTKMRESIKKTRIFPLIYAIGKSKTFNFFPRILPAMRYYNSKYAKILKWGLSSNEETNYTYDLTDDNLKYLAHTIAIVCNRNFEDIMEFIYEAKQDRELSGYVIDKTKEFRFRRVADLRCDFGRRLGWYAFTRMLKPKIVIETGVDKGLGAILLCSALLKNRDEGHDGKYYGTDINPNAGYLFGGKYQEVGEILYGDSIESLEKLQCQVDLFIHDSEHSPDYEYGEYLAIKDKISSDAIILSDNSHCTSKLADFSKQNNRRFLYFHEVPKDHWYPGGGIGISF